MCLHLQKIPHNIEHRMLDFAYRGANMGPHLRGSGDEVGKRRSTQSVVLVGGVAGERDRGALMRIGCGRRRSQELGK